MSGSINSFQFVCKTLHFQMLRQLQQQQQPEQQPPLTSRATAMTMPEDVCPCLCPPGATSFLFFNVVVLRLAKDSRELEATYCRTCLFTARKARRTTSSRGTRSTLTRQPGRQAGGPEPEQQQWQLDSHCRELSLLLVWRRLSFASPLPDLSRIASRRTIRAISLQKLRRLARDCHKSKRH